MAAEISPLWIVVGLVLFVLGARWAVMRRAGDDHQRTKAALPGLRSAYWRGFWAMLRAASLVLIVVLVLGWRDFDGDSTWLHDLITRSASRRSADGRTPSSPGSLDRRLGHGLLLLAWIVPDAAPGIESWQGQMQRASQNLHFPGRFSPCWPVIA
jgi:protein-S-isoprenylcysteine O-methyltransferase Ste14